MPDVLLGVLVGLPVLGISWYLRGATTRDLLLRSGQREDGSWEPGRAPSDMTPVGKVALGAGMAGVVACVVLRVTGSDDGRLWVAALAVVLVSVVTVTVSERRRVRRRALDVEGGPGRAERPGAD
ncbi:hypothetical protein J1G42_01855 [Cellulomonas sp. zg-ZUI222]|uniref:hypothetical protein n=1 Tax=Cellulomonas wangleii TaxID=2816956 RepID=UPI001A94CCC6|nr:hypothetical protein [Cellulomonas wangleii]MBO0919567.1 hypothetical protein [Cellulomonas wangleii]